MKNKNIKRIKYVSITLMSVLVLSIIGFFVYLSIYYKAESIAIEILSYENTFSYENLMILEPDSSSENAIIFYPGAKVEAISYLPILNKLREEGVLCVLVEMPFNMAIFDVHAADKVFDELIWKYPEMFECVEKWYMAGHSMGGAMASSYASDNVSDIDGLILLGSYVYGDFPTENSLTIYGTFNSNLEEYIDYDDNVYIIDGGNHAQFGNYGEQKGDPSATITTEEQQEFAVRTIIEFLQK